MYMDFLNYVSWRANFSNTLGARVFRLMSKHFLLVVSELYYDF